MAGTRSVSWGTWTGYVPPTSTAVASRKRGRELVENKTEGRTGGVGGATRIESDEEAGVKGEGTRVFSCVIGERCVNGAVREDSEISSRGTCGVPIAGRDDHAP